MANPHPYIVHFPIALFICAIVCEIATRLLPESDDSSKQSLRVLLSNTSLVTSIGAALAAIAAVITGLLAARIVPDTGKVHEVLNSHETLGYVVTASAIVFAATKLWSHIKKSDKLSLLLITVGLLGILVIALTANEGGELVYKYGVGMSEAVAP
jgi:uncharacterized membrane protein